jgi:hypothetical protein
MADDGRQAEPQDSNCAAVPINRFDLPMSSG